MISKILVPLDIDAEKSGAEAIAFAKKLAVEDGAQIVLLHVKELVPGYVASHLPDDFNKMSTDTAHKNLSAAAAAQGLGDTADVVIRDGNPSAEILDYAKDTGADLIVIASHNPGFGDYFLGSTAARVVRHAHCSVLVLRHPD